MIRSVAFVACIGYATAGFFDGFGGQSAGGNGAISSILAPVSTVVNAGGNLVGAAFGGAWGAVVPGSMNKGAINAACGNSFNSADNTNVATTGDNIVGTAVGTVWSAVVPKSVNQGAIQGAETMGQTGDICSEFKSKIDFTGTVDLTYSTSADRDRLLQAVLSAYSTLFDKSSTAGLSIFFVSDRPNAFNPQSHTVTYRVAGLSKSQVDVNSVYSRLQALFQQNPPQGITGLSATITTNVA
jgi:hypothetical protein